MRINDIISEDKELNELNLKGLGTGLGNIASAGLGKLPGALAGGVVQGAKNIWQGAKQGYAGGKAALAPNDPQPTQQVPSNDPAASPNATATQQKPGLVSTFKQAFQQGQQQGQGLRAPQKGQTGPSLERLNQISQTMAATIGNRDDAELEDSLTYLQNQGHGDNHPIVKLYKDELAKRKSSQTPAAGQTSAQWPAGVSKFNPHTGDTFASVDQAKAFDASPEAKMSSDEYFAAQKQPAAGGAAPAASPAPASKPATINAAPVSPNIDSIKKAYTNLDPTEREKLKGELDIIDDQERLASGTNESLDDILKLARLK